MKKEGFESGRWLSIVESNLKQGGEILVRDIAQPCNVFCEVGNGHEKTTCVVGRAKSCRTAREQARNIELEWLCGLDKD